MIPAKFKLSPKEYHSIHSRLRRRLNLIAFNSYFKCQRCGCHSNLEMHIPNCNPDLFDQPGFYIILCKKCHDLLG